MLCMPIVCAKSPDRVPFGVAELKEAARCVLLWTPDVVAVFRAPQLRLPFCPSALYFLFAAELPENRRPCETPRQSQIAFHHHLCQRDPYHRDLWSFSSTAVRGRMCTEALLVGCSFLPWLCCRAESEVLSTAGSFSTVHDVRNVGHWICHISNRGCCCSGLLSALTVSDACQQKIPLTLCKGAWKARLRNVQEGADEAIVARARVELH